MLARGHARTLRLNGIAKAYQGSVKIAQNAIRTA
jgi:hypothetical protein